MKVKSLIVAAVLFATTAQFARADEESVAAAADTSVLAQIMTIVESVVDSIVKGV